MQALRLECFPALTVKNINTPLAYTSSGVYDAVHNECTETVGFWTMTKRKITKSLAAPASLPDQGAVVGYARVSTAEQSLSLQIDALQKYGCDRIEVEKVSAASSKRRQLEQALGLLRSGDKFVVWKMDRLARSLSDLLARVKHIEGLGAQFVSLTENIDTGTASGRLLFHVLGALGEFERDLIRERTRAGLAVAKANGQRLGAMPKFKPDEIRKMQSDRDAGMSVRELAEMYGCSQGTVQKWTVRLASRGSRRDV